MGALAAQLLGALLRFGLGLVETLGVGENLVGQLQYAKQRHRSQRQALISQALIRTKTGHRIGCTRVC